jgi:hypothetical protein
MGEAVSMRQALATAGKVILIVLAIPFAAAAAVIATVLRSKERRSAAEVAAYLRNFLEGGGGEWDWDDFTSVPIANPKLDAIRRRAAILDTDSSEDATIQLRQLLSEAESLAAAEGEN